MKQQSTYFLNTAILIILASFSAIFGQELLGERLKVTVIHNGGQLVANRIQFRDNDKEPNKITINGCISDVAFRDRKLFIGPAAIVLSKETHFQDLQPEDLQPGKSISVRGIFENAGELFATSIEKESSEGAAIEIIGEVSQSQSLKNGDLQLVIMGMPITIPMAVYYRGTSLIRHPDDKRPEQQFTVPLFGKPLVIGGEIGSKSGFDGDFKLNRAEQDDKLDMENAIELEMFYRFSRNASLFLETKSNREWLLYEEGGESSVTSEVERGESWLLWGNIAGTPLSVQIGRQNFREDREWWWDRDLDAIRFYIATRKFYLEMGLAREIAPLAFNQRKIEPDKEKITRVISRMGLQFTRNHQFDLFFLAQHDYSDRPFIGNIIAAGREDDIDASMGWLGARFSGNLDFEIVGDAEYWVDIAGMGGQVRNYEFDDVEIEDEEQLVVAERSTANAVGWAMDLGMSWQTPLPLSPTFTASYAIGSGDDNPTDKWDRNFRQTGLHDNNNRYNGVDRFRYYGELFRPELSNISIFSFSAGFPMLKSSSLEFLYHRYVQVVASEELAGKIKADPNGIDRELGWELDAVFGIEEWKRLELEVLGAIYRSGAAFGANANKLAYHVTFKMDFNF